MRPNELDGIWRHIDVGAANECWEWQLSISSRGYGRYRYQGQALGAHRVVYELEHGPIEQSTMVKQKCKNKLCCNPKHLVAVENWRREKWVF